jgi:hypothetical protein
MRRVAATKTVAVMAGSPVSRAMRTRQLTKQVIILVMWAYHNHRLPVHHFVPRVAEALTFFDPSMVTVRDDMDLLVMKLSTIDIKFNSKFLQRYITACMAIGNLVDEIWTDESYKFDLIDEFVVKYNMKKETVLDAIRDKKNFDKHQL